MSQRIRMCSLTVGKTVYRYEIRNDEGASLGYTPSPITDGDYLVVGIYIPVSFTDTMRDNLKILRIPGTGESCGKLMSMGGGKWGFKVHVPTGNVIAG